MSRLTKLRIALYGSEALAAALYLLSRKLGFSPLWALLPLVAATACNWLIRDEQLRAAAKRQEQEQAEQEQTPQQDEAPPAPTAAENAQGLEEKSSKYDR